MGQGSAGKLYRPLRFAVDLKLLEKQLSLNKKGLALDKKKRKGLSFPETMRKHAVSQRD